MDPAITLTVNSTHFYLIGCRGGFLLVDAGWELGRFAAQMSARKVPFAAIRYVMFTHNHPDHAGLVQDVKERAGARLIIHPCQIPYLEDLRAYTAKRGERYNPIRVEAGDLVGPDRAALAAIGVAGEIVATPGHSDDSVSLVLEGGAAFIGDLPAPEFTPDEDLAVVCASWKRLFERGARRFYHSHMDPFAGERIREFVKGL